MQATLSAGTVFREHYVVVDLLNHGKSSATYLVRDRSNRQVLLVLKEIGKAGLSNRYQTAFEAVKLKSLHHPSLPSIYDVFDDEESGSVYILMQYIKGHNLEIIWQRQQKQGFSWHEVLDLLTPIISAVAYLHAQLPPIMHGNIKLSKIVVQDISKETMLVGVSLTSENDSDINGNGKPPTRNGTSALANSRKITDPRIDIYALAAVFYTLLTGIVPPDRLYRSTVVGNKKPDPLVPLNKVKPTLPPSLARTISRALSINNDCFDSIEQFWHSLNTASIERQMAAGRRGASLKYVELDTNPYVQKIGAGQVEVTTDKTPALSAHSVMEQSPTSPATLAAPPETPAIIETKKQLRTEPSPEHLPVMYRYRARMLLLIVCTLFLTLLTSAITGVGLWLYTTGQHSAGFQHTTAERRFKSTPIHSEPTPTPMASPVLLAYPTLDKTYEGTIHDVAGNLTTQMSLQNIQQQQNNIRGNFRGFLQNGSFTGRISISRHILFIVAGIIGLPPITFTGVMEADGGFAGTYCSRNQIGVCIDYGVWSVSSMAST